MGKPHTPKTPIAGLVFRGLMVVVVEFLLSRVIAWSSAYANDVGLRALALAAWAWVFLVAGFGTFWLFRDAFEQDK